MRARHGQRQALALAVGIALCLQLAYGFKENEFKKCAQTSFCSRNRGVEQGKNFEIAPASVQLNVATLTATLVNTQHSKHLQLSLTSHADGFLRLLIDESPSVGRYQVPSDILVSGWENKKAGFTETARNANSVTLTVGETAVTLGFKPFTMSVTIKGVPALQLNSRHLFNFEHRRAKQVRLGCGCELSGARG